MDLKIDKKNYKKKKMNSKSISIWFLIFSILLTFVLYFYNMSLINSNNKLDESIKVKKASIIDLEKDSNIKILSLYNLNKSSIMKIEDYSKITLYIKHLLELQRKYNIKFEWFQYNNWKLWTQAISTSDSYWINYKKVVNFIEKYRKNDDLSALFDLNLIKNILSKNDRQDNVFKVELELKNNISQILKDSIIKKEELRKIKEEEDNIRKLELRAKREILLQKQQDKTGSGANSSEINNQ